MAGVRTVSEVNWTPESQPLFPIVLGREREKWKGLQLTIALMRSAAIRMAKNFLVSVRNTKSEPGAVATG